MRLSASALFAVFGMLRCSRRGQTSDKRRCISGQIVLAGRCQRTAEYEWIHRQSLVYLLLFCGGDTVLLLAEMDKRQAHAAVSGCADLSACRICLCALFPWLRRDVLALHRRHGGCVLYGRGVFAARRCVKIKSTRFTIHIAIRWFWVTQSAHQRPRAGDGIFLLWRAGAHGSECT